MKSLIKVFLVLAAVFGSTFLLMKFSGVLTVEQIEGWLTHARTLSPLYVGTLVAVLLFADLFIAVPTLTITILAGYFLGHGYGAVSALTGVTLAGVCGYVLSRRYGDAVLCVLVKEESQRREAVASFQQHGFMMILLSRALPILPEVTACLSGMTGMKFSRFITAWLISAVPYTLLGTYAGSISTIENPKPAIYAAIGISMFLWIAWFVYRRWHQPKYS